MEEVDSRQFKVETEKTRDLMQGVIIWVDVQRNDDVAGTSAP